MTAPYMAAGGLLRVYPATDPTGAGLVWAHGGAFVHGTLDMNESDWVALELAVRGTTVVSVDYRLTTETENRYPAASDDMLAAWAGRARTHAIWGSCRSSPPSAARAPAETSPRGRRCV